MKRIKRNIVSIVALVGLFSLPCTAGQTVGGVTLTEVVPRVVTPNGDLLNDVVFFKFDNTLSGLPLETSIWDIHGAKVGDMALDSNETALTWNGKDESGRSVPSGIYIYSIKIGKNQATGTVVVAR
jgi:flagellar hook assembly protein FlgD